MSDGVCDTSILIRLISGDDPAKQDGAIALFERVEGEHLSLDAPVTVIADAVYVLTSRRLYNRPRPQVAAKLTTLVRLPNFHVKDRRIVLRALQLFAGAPYLDFGDAMIIAQAQRSGVQTVYAYDHDFDRVPGITRLEP